MLYAGRQTRTKDLVTQDQLTGAAAPLLMHVADQKATGSASGTASASNWDLRDLNTIIVNQIQGASLSGLTISLPTGNYYAEAFSVFGNTANTNCRLFNVTSGLALINGLNGSGSSTGNSTVSVQGYFSLTAQSSIRLQYNGGNTGATLGVPKNYSGLSEKYSEVFIWKLS